MGELDRSSSFWIGTHGWLLGFGKMRPAWEVFQMASSFVINNELLTNN